MDIRYLQTLARTRRKPETPALDDTFHTLPRTGKVREVTARFNLYARARGKFTSTSPHTQMKAIATATATAMASTSHKSFNTASIGVSMTAEDWRLLTITRGNPSSRP